LFLSLGLPGSTVDRGLKPVQSSPDGADVVEHLLGADAGAD
jgi:hypothetical protein